MRILFITDNFPPEVNAPAGRSMDHCREWIKSGAEITVITGVPNFPHGRVYPGYKNWLFQTEYIEGVRVIRLWTFIRRNRGFLLRILDYLSFAFVSFFAGFRLKTDVILTTSPQFFTAMSGFLLSFFRRKPWVFELRDLWPESLLAVGVMKHKGRFYRWLERLELFLYKRADKIVALTDSFKEDLVKRGINADKIEVIRNGVNPVLFYPREKNGELLKKLGAENKTVLAYIGTHGLAHKLEFVIKLIVRMRDPDLFLLFIGDGAEKERLQKMAVRFKMQNISFLDAIPKDQIPDYLALADISIIPLRKNDAFRKVIPSKIFESAAMRRPILLGVDGEARRLVEYYGAGLFCEPENTSEWKDKLQKLKEDRQLYERCQSGGENLAADHARERLAAQMYLLLHGLVS